MATAELGITVNTAGVEQAVADLDKIAPAAQRAEQATTKLAQSTSASMQQAANQVETFADRINKALNVRAPTGDADYARRAEDIAAVGNELDKLRAKYNQSFAIMREYRSEATKIREAHAVGAISINETAAAMERLRSTTQRSIDTERQLRQNRGSGAPGSGGLPGGSAGQQRMMQSNMMYQLQDVAVTAAMGMSPAMIALQQGTQLGMNFQQAGGIKAGLTGLAGGLGAMLSVSQLLPIAIVGVGAAFYQWLTGADEKVKDVNTLLKEHLKAVNDLGAAYGAAGVKTEDFYRKSIAGAEAAQRASQKELKERRDSLESDVLSQAEMAERTGAIQNLYRMLSGTTSGESQVSGVVREALKTNDFEKMDAALKEIVKNNPELQDMVDKFQLAIDPIREINAQLKMTGEQLVSIERQGDLLKQAVSAARTDNERVSAARDLAEFENRAADAKTKAAEGDRAAANEAAKIAVEQRDYFVAQQKNLDDSLRKEKDELALIDTRGAKQEVARQALEKIHAIEDEANKRGIKAGDERFASYQKEIDAVKEWAVQLSVVKAQEEEIERVRSSARTDAEIQSMNARTDAARIAAAGASAGAGKPGGIQTEFEISEAQRKSAASIEKEHADATRSRHQALDDLAKSQEHEMELIGATAGEQAALNEQFRMEQELRKDAETRGIDVSQKELDLIKQKTEAYGKLVDQLNKQKLIQDLIFERSLIGMTKDEAAIAQRLRGTGLSTSGPEAGYIRDTNRLQYIHDLAFDTGKDFLTSMSSAVTDGGDDIGKALVQAMVGSAQRTLDKVLDKLFDNIMNSILGTGPGGGGVVGAVATALTGGGGVKAGAAGGGGTADALISLLGGSGGAAIVSGVTGGTTAARTGNIPLTKVDIGGGQTVTVASAAASRFAGLFKDLKAAGYPVSSVGEGGYSDRFVAGTSNLSQHAYGAAVDINPKQNPQAFGATGNFSQYGINPSELAQKWGLEWGGNWKKPDTMHFQVPRGEDSELGKAVDKLTTGTTKVATSMINLSGISDKTVSSLSQFAGGMGGLSNILKSFMSSSTGGGSSWFQGLMGSFGGAGGALNFMSGISPAATADILSGSWGLFHEGNVGVSSVRSRYFPSIGPWLNAPRLHNGNMFSAGEYPAVLKKGEPVFPNVEAAAAFGGPKTIVNVHNYANAEVKTKSTETGQGMTLDIMVDKLVASQIDTRGTASNTAIRGKFGVSERLRMR